MREVRGAAPRQGTISGVDTAAWIWHIYRMKTNPYEDANFKRAVIFLNVIIGLTALSMLVAILRAAIK